MRWFFFFNDTATTEIYTLSLHDALPISLVVDAHAVVVRVGHGDLLLGDEASESLWRSLPLSYCVRGRKSQVAGTPWLDRKSTRLNSSHANISYAVFCLKKKTRTTSEKLD